MQFIALFTLLLSSLASARPSPRQSSLSSFHGIDVDSRSASSDATLSCTSGNACINGEFAQCVNGKYVLSPCGPGSTCAALPLVDSPGTKVTCTTQSLHLNARTAAVGVTGRITSANATVASCSSGFGPGSTNSSSAQTSLTLLPAVIATNFSQDGLNASTSVTGEVASLTSTNNFINWCATLPSLPITNGQQLKKGSCNPAPMGAIPSTSNMPSAKFVTPVNLAVISPNTTFQILLAVKNIATGYFVNPDTNYFGAPQQLDATTGLIQGHAHIVIEALASLYQTTPTDPTKFVFFAALNKKADASGYLHVNVTGGLPKGTYRMSTLVAAMNHQPALLPVAHRGVPDDMIYFSVLETGESTNTTTPTATPTHTPRPTNPLTMVSSGIPANMPTTSAGNFTNAC